jgi:hypothetical protein
MTLHEAIEQILLKEGRPLTTTEIANKLNQTGLYQKKDGSKITPFQIHGRTKNYDHIFSKDGSLVSLKNKTGTPKIAYLSKEKSTIDSIGQKPELALKVLMNEKNYKVIDDIPFSEIDLPGLYAIRVKNIKSLPFSFANELIKRDHNLLYIGVATQSLKTRLSQELLAKGHGTFFRSVGALLGYKPAIGSLINAKNQIIDWIKSNLLINHVKIHNHLESLETQLILEQSPLLNIAKNPMAINELKELRAECVRVANSIDMF